MTTIIFSSTIGYAPQAKDDFILEAGTVLSNHNFTAFGASGASFAGLSLDVAGTIEDASYGISLFNGAVEGSLIHVAATGSVSAKYAAIYLDGSGGSIVNDGALAGETWGVNIIGSQNAVVNQGAITGSTGVSFQGDGNALVNHGVISSDGSCVSVSLKAGETFSLANDGLITSAQYCFVAAGEGDVTVVNRGTMEG
ncbi:MAG: hypothetical protein KDJ87_20890, partial [Rhizobiaceae bacterium]|nr:hypothetical protein [Rhizobiaceae bacterium]